MKTLRIFVLYCAVGLFPFEGASQQILNGGFEETVSDTTSFYPQGYLRPLYWGFGLHTLGCGGVKGEMTTDSYSGDWAVKLETVNCAGPLVAGMLGNGSEVYTMHFAEGFAQVLNLRPDQLEFFYKYLPVNEDTAYFSALLFNYPDSIFVTHPNWNTYIDTVGIAHGMITGTVENYTQYLSNFEYVTTEIPKYLRVYFSSNHDQGEAIGANVHAHAGTTLWIDNVELNYLTTSSEDLLDETQVRIYPNPVADHFQIEVPNITPLRSIVVFDSFLRIVQTLNPQDRLHPLKNLSPGIYFVRIETEKGNVVKKVVKE